MRVLHYIMGIPPVRGGGLIKYATDLMVTQIEQGDEVYLLIPGRLNRNNRNKTKIKEKGKWQGNIPKYVIENPCPIPMVHGIKDFEWYMTAGDKDVYVDFLNKIRVDVIHVHSLMGIHMNFLVAANELNIPIIFTTHDYFGICPTTELLKDYKVCDEKDWSKCSKCCKGAFSRKHLEFDQSKMCEVYMKYKCINRCMNKVRDWIGLGKTDERFEKKSENEEYLNSDRYMELQNYYKEMFNMISYFHFNSIITRELYERRLGKTLNGKVISITHREITDNRRLRKYGKILRIGFLGKCTYNKGYYVLVDAVNEMVINGMENILINIYTETMPDCTHSFIKVNPTYKYNEIGKIMDESDVIVVPSMGTETFGFTVIEALSFGVPTVVTENVGAKDILNNEKFGWIVKPNKKDIENVLEKLYTDKGALQIKNRNIVNGDFMYTIDNHVKEINELYKVAGLLKKWGTNESFK